MEPPSSQTAAQVLKQKVRLLRCVKAVPFDHEHAFLGQYGAGNGEPGYLDDPTVPEGSTCATFASVLLRVDNARWRGVPFLITAGKGMDERLCELRVRFKPVKTSTMGLGASANVCNELVVRVQPEPSVSLVMVAKEPGITSEQARKPTVMEMSHKSQFPGAYFGAAHERMLLNACQGDQSLFVSSAELVEAWRIFTPLLDQIEQRQTSPVLHPFGQLPDGYREWVAARGIHCSKLGSDQSADRYAC